MGIFGKPLLVHYHIFKNAGTSVDKILSESFGETWAVCDDSPEKLRLFNNDIEAFAKANPGVCAISSHQARPFPIHRGFIPIVFLRHPIDRARSIYYFTKRDPVQFDHALARDGSFKDYVNWWLDRPSSALRNYQVIYLSQASFRVADVSEAVACREDLWEVRNFLSSLRFFGLVRRFQDSCRGFDACYKRTFPALQMRFIRENASTDDSLSETAALKVAREELGEATYMRLVQANRLDLALYKRAMELFDRNLARVSKRGLRRVRRRLPQACQGLVDVFQGISGRRQNALWREMEP